MVTIQDNGANEKLLINTIKEYCKYAPTNTLSGESVAKEFCEYVWKHDPTSNGGKKTVYVARLQDLLKEVRSLERSVKNELEMLNCEA